MPHAAVPTEISLRTHVTWTCCPNQLGLFHESIWAYKTLQKGAGLVLQRKTGGHWENALSIKDNQPVRLGSMSPRSQGGGASQMRGETFRTIENQRPVAS